ncbi:PD-(D/E)XK motif protein [Mammaliicoccus sciuri]|uniref:PD-(D/E)XK motif protein n=1 Tax=Mammaliicoccus sciuri TaxID=1296 RepID=UPI00065B585A|nr:PD-(D/E)XK motif protein [Mammaliicoccus sciuri]WRY63659.1 PD-(D/E)XK motif protein [Mammaliicoccus sciuri]SQE49420.1 Uncharacterised protein [Mammaliicoccus sciuri]
MYSSPGNSYNRIKGTEVIAIYYGENDEFLPSIYIKLKNKPKLNIKSKLLNTNIFLRKDKLWALEISLLSNKYIGVFKVLADDLISTIDDESIQEIAEKNLIYRYNEWQKLFDSKVLETLTYKKIQGLVGELFFLDKKMFGKYGIKNSIKSWMGPLGANQDFQIENTWYEIKTKSFNKEKIYISNQNQFKSNSDGSLVIINVEKASDISEQSVNLIKLYEKILGKIEDKSIQEEFKKKLAYLGFVPNDLYKDYNFYITSVVYYKVDNTFPILKSSNSIDPFVNVKYEMHLPSIKEYISKEEKNGQI